MTAPPRRRRSLAGLVVATTSLAAALSAGPALAYRPFDFTDADVAPLRRFEFEVGPAEVVSQGDERFLRAPKLGISYGVGNGWELGIDGSNQWSLEPETGFSRSRVHDVGVSVKKVLRRGSLQDESGPSVATEGATLFPVSGESESGFSLTMIGSSANAKGVFHANVELEHSTEGDDALATGVVGELGADNTMSPVFEVGLEGVRGGPPQRSALLGVIYVPNERLEFDVALRWAWTAGEDRIMEFRAGVTHQISTRRLAEHMRQVVPGVPRHRRRH